MLDLNTAFDIEKKPVSKQDDNSIAINTNNTDRFTEANLAMQKKLIVKEAYPELYGDELPSDMTFLGFELYDIETLNDSMQKWGKQTGRASTNKKEDKIRINILEGGYKLKYPPISIARYPDGTIKYITGRTRTKILRNNCNFKNAIVGVYKVKSNKSFKTQNLRFNLVESPAGIATTGDVIAVGQDLVSTNDIKKTLDDIKTWVLEATLGGPFTETTKDIIAQAIYNNFLTRPYVNSWTPETAHEWMNEHHYKKASDQYPNSGLSKKETVYVQTGLGEQHLNDYLYIVCATSSWTKNLSRVASLAANTNFKGKQIRVILHTSTLETSNSIKNLETQYKNRVDNHNLHWKEELNNYASAFYSKYVGVEKIIPEINTPVVIYATLPAIGKIHNDDELVLL